MTPAIWEFDDIVGGLSRGEISTFEAAVRFDAVALRFSEVLDQAEVHEPTPILAETYTYFIGGLHEMEKAGRAAATLADPPASGVPAEAIVSRDTAEAMFFEASARASTCD